MANIYRKHPSLFASKDDFDYIIEPNKDNQIAHNKQEADERNIKEIDNPLPMVTDLDRMQIESLLKRDDANKIYRKGPLTEIEIRTLKTIQPKLFSTGHETINDPNDDAPVVINLQGKTNVVIDGNHRIYQAMQDGKTKIKVHYTKHTDYM